MSNVVPSTRFPFPTTIVWRRIRNAPRIDYL